MSSNEFDPPSDRTAHTLTDADINTEPKATRRMVVVAGACVAAATAAALGFVYREEVSNFFQGDAAVGKHTD